MVKIKKKKCITKHVVHHNDNLWFEHLKNNDQVNYLWWSNDLIIKQ